jgi:hypothetical protein
MIGVCGMAGSAAESVTLTVSGADGNRCRYLAHRQLVIALVTKEKSSLLVLINAVLRPSHETARSSEVNNSSASRARAR